jgi:hypothetical protein
MKTIYLIICVLAVPFFLNAQNMEESGKKAKRYVSSEYDRNALTFIGLDFDENLSSEVLTRFSEAQKVPEKYYDNTISHNLIKTEAKRDSAFGVMLKLKENDIAKWLNENKVGQQILSIWFNRQPDGSFNVDILKERGLFNANDHDFIVASSSKRGESSLMDMGMQLVNQSYVLAFDFYDIMTMEQYYNKNETATEKRTSNGYRASLNSYLLKLDFNDSVAAVFFRDYWVGENDPNKADRIAAFNNANFPFVAVSNQHNSVSATQYNPEQPLAPEVQKTKSELLDQMGTSAIEMVLTDIERQRQDFRVKAMVSDVKPISAKIGKKEDLKFDQRYFVHENRVKRNGDITSRRVAVVKSMKVVDNRKVTTGQTEPSTFYQIAGGKVDNYGMFLEQRNDVGLNLFLGTTVGGLSGYTGRVEYYMSKVFGGLVGKDKSGKALTSWKIYVEGAYRGDSYEFDEFVDDFTFTRFSFGVAKDFYPISFLHWGPFIGYGVESGDWEDNMDEEKIATDFVEMGARLGVNLAHNIQLLGSVNYYMMLSSEIQDKDGEVLNEDFDYKGFFEDRMGLGISIGLRIMF